MRKMAEEKKLELEHRDHSQSVVDPKEHHLPMAADATGITTRVWASFFFPPTLSATADAVAETTIVS